MKKRTLFVSLGIALLFSSCNVLSDLMTEPTYEVPDRTSDRPSEPVGSEARLRAEIVDFAEQYLGTPYKYAGDSPRSGFDCSGFTSFVLGKYDIPLSRNSQAQSKDGRKIRLKEVQPGDLVFFKRSGGSIFHVAMVVRNSRKGIEVVHSTTSRGVIRENISQSSYWSSKIYAASDVIRP